MVGECYTSSSSSTQMDQLNPKPISEQLPLLASWRKPCCSVGVAGA